MFDASEALQSCKDEAPRLTVNFGPASNISEAIAKQPGQESWPKGINMVYQYSHREFVRKQQNDFGW